MGNLLPLFCTFLIVTSAVLVAIGWYLIKKRKKIAHKKIMILAACFALLFFIVYFSRTIFIGNTSFNGPYNIKPYYIGFLIFHISLAVTGLIFGAVTLTLAFKGQIIKHKKMGPFTAMIWFFSATTGIVVYLCLYIIWEPGPTTSMMKAILGL